MARLDAILPGASLNTNGGGISVAAGGRVRGHYTRICLYKPGTDYGGQSDPVKTQEERKMAALLKYSEAVEFFGIQKKSVAWRCDAP